MSAEEIELKMQGVKTPLPPLPGRESANLNPRKRIKFVRDQTFVQQDNGNHRDHGIAPYLEEPTNLRKKSSKRILQRESLPSLDAELAPVLNNDYKELRYRYKLIANERLALDRELNNVDIDIQNLEREKDSLLDKLIVLEGIIDPSEMY